MIAEIDPGVQHPQTISFGFQPAPGVRAKEKHVLGRQSGFRRDLARKIWYALGFYLHTRPDREEHDATRLRKTLEKVAARLEVYEQDRVIAGGGALRSFFKCQDCGRSISKRVRSIADNPYVQCPNSVCGAVYHCVEKPNRIVEHTMLQENLVCKKCGGDNWLGIHRLRRGAEQNAIMNCSGCKVQYRMVEYVTLKDAQE